LVYVATTGSALAVSDTTHHVADRAAPHSAATSLRGNFFLINQTLTGDHLTGEYRDLARAMTASLSRKRPSPLA
jgi:hypothetical protein